jgi:hypothetical protein
VADVELHDEVFAWLDTLTDSEWQRVVVTVDRLAELGHQARMPMSRSLGDGLFELRFALSPTSRRITYKFLIKDSRIISLTTFRKQRNNERHEIDRARTAAAEYALRYP